MDTVMGKSHTPNIMKRNILKIFFINWMFTFGLAICGMECTAQTVSGQVAGHDYVDLGLPSGTLWAIR